LCFITHSKTELLHLGASALLPGLVAGCAQRFRQELATFGKNLGRGATFCRLHGMECKRPAIMKFKSSILMLLTSKLR
jgi:hypothetical protein